MEFNECFCRGFRLRAEPSSAIVESTQQFMFVSSKAERTFEAPSRKSAYATAWGGDTPLLMQMDANEHSRCEINFILWKSIGLWIL